MPFHIHRNKTSTIGSTAFSAMDEGYRSANFESLASSKGLDNETITALCREDYDSERALREMDLTQDLPALPIHKDQQYHVERWVRELNELRASGDYSVNSLEKSDCTEEALLSCDACFKNLQNRDAIIADVEKSLNSNGLLDFENMIREKVSEFDTLFLNICVVGDSAVGKSGLISSLLNEGSTGNRAGTKNKKKTVLDPHSTGKFSDIIFWDCPGVQRKKSCTFLFPKGKDVPLELFDAMIICSSRRFSEVDLWLTKLGSDNDLSLYYVRSKVDLDISSERRDRGSQFQEPSLINNIKEDIIKNLSNAESKDPKVFVLSTRIEHKHCWDFPRLQRELKDNPPRKNITQFIEATHSLGLSYIERKKKDIGKRIRSTAEHITTSDKDEQESLRRSVAAMAKAFGMKPADHSTSCEQLLVGPDGNAMLDPSNVDFSYNVEACKRFRWIGIWFFGIGFLIGLCVDKIVTKNRIEKARTNVKRECEFFLKASLDIVSEKAKDVVKAASDAIKNSSAFTEMHDILSDKCP